MKNNKQEECSQELLTWMTKWTGKGLEPEIVIGQMECLKVLYLQRAVKERLKTL